ncbi:hypothetical protein EON77_00245 [bacterium]|nr:MAG: hypothetical protein EON77_00245 [bacterium]
MEHRRIIPVLSPDVTPPPPGLAVRMAIGDNIFVVVGRPGAERLPDLESRVALRRTVRELAQYLRDPAHVRFARHRHSISLAQDLADGRTEILTDAKRVNFATPSVRDEVHGGELFPGEEERVDDAIERTLGF